MSIFQLFRRILILLVALSAVSTTYLYLYPIFHGCAFPSPGTSSVHAFLGTIRQHTNDHLRPDIPVASFRLLALGDPQLEGDSSLADTGDGSFPSLASLWADVPVAPSWTSRVIILRCGLGELLSHDIPAALRFYRKRLDLLGNDYYLAHIYRTLYWWSKPTHVTVLGDLLGSQWVTDEEFARRGRRYWRRVFKGATRIEDDITVRAGQEILGADDRWKKRVMNIVGNHDVGYAGDMTKERVQRFEEVFGKANWEVTFLDVNGSDSLRDTSIIDIDAPKLRIVVLNSLNLDTPALEEDLQHRTYDFVNEVILSSRPVEDRTTATVLLTHLPLHKEAGVCVDSPFFDFHTDEHGGGVKEQNHISYNAGKGILEGIFGMSGNPNAPGGGLGRNGIILTGHDHEGCDVYHHIPASMEDIEHAWNATRWREALLLARSPIPGIREITVRSMMGDFGGNAGLLSAWFDDTIGEWHFEYSTCSLGVQHTWWAIHALDVLTACSLLLGALIRMSHLLFPTSNQKEAASRDCDKGIGRELSRMNEDAGSCFSRGNERHDGIVHEQGSFRRRNKRKD